MDANARAPNLEHAVALLRVAQEGLTNAVRHSDAAKVEIELAQEDKTLTANGSTLILSVSDDGNGARQLIRGNGLNGMAERLAALGGSLQITQLAPGLRLSARLPLPVEMPL